MRDGVTELINNSRNVQCGSGFAGGDAPQMIAGINLDPACPGAGPGKPNPAIFDHGIEQGSEALDAETTWIQTVRPPQHAETGRPKRLGPGSQVFNDTCASCHGGAKWTKSQVLYLCW